jgi:hypothetical protein
LPYNDFIQLFEQSEKQTNGQGVTMEEKNEFEWKVQIKGFKEIKDIQNAYIKTSNQIINLVKDYNENPKAKVNFTVVQTGWLGEAERMLSIHDPEYTNNIIALTINSTGQIIGRLDQEDPDNNTQRIRDLFDLLYKKLNEYSLTSR